MYLIYFPTAVVDKMSESTYVMFDKNKGGVGESGQEVCKGAVEMKRERRKTGQRLNIRAWSE